jgi:sugar phosphate permease
MTVVSGLAVWTNGLYVRPMEDEFGWSRAEVSLGFSAAILASGLAGPLIGVWIDRLGLRSCMLVGGVLAAATYVLLAFIEERWQWYGLAAINAGFRQMTFFIPMNVLITRWFDRRRGAALSILGSGFSLGGLIMLPLVTLIIDATNWRGGFLFSGAVMALVVVPITLLVLRDWPADRGTSPDGDEAVSEPATGVGRRHGGLTPAEALREPMFWVLAVALMLFFYGLVGWTVHLLPFFESRGLSRDTAAAVISLSSGAGMVARLVLGGVADRFSRFEQPSALLILGIVGGFLALLLIDGWLGIAVFLTLWLVGTAAAGLAEALSLSRSFGLAYFATIFGIVVVIETSGQILSPSISGWIYDETGSYDFALVMYSCTFVASAALFAIASRMKQPVVERAARLEAVVT